MSEEKQRQLDDINRPMNEEFFNNLEKKYQELAKVKTDSEQIEEMAKVIDDIESNAYIECYDKAFADADKIAETLYNAGYRKQSEGEWIVTYADSGSFGEYEPFIEFKCPKCGSVYGIESGQYDWQYGDPIPWVACPLCGAKMKGGAE